MSLEYSIYLIYLQIFRDAQYHKSANYYITMKYTFQNILLFLQRHLYSTTRVGAPVADPGFGRGEGGGGTMEGVAIGWAE